MPPARPASARSGLTAYLIAAVNARIATEAIGPAILLASITVLGSAATGSYLVASITATSAIAGPIVGALVDRSTRPRMMFTLTLACTATGAAGLALLIGNAPFIVLALTAAFAGLGYPAITGALSAQVHLIVPPAAVPRAYAADAGTYSIASLIGPPIAAALLVLAPTAPLWFPAIATVAAIGLLRLLPLRHRAPADHESATGQSIAQALRKGLHAIAARPALRANTIISTGSFAGQAALFVALPLIAQQRLGSLAASAIVLAALAIGGVAGAVLAFRVPVRSPDLVVVITVSACAVSMASLAIDTGIAGLLAGACCFGIAEAVFLTSVFGVRNREAPADVRSQVFTTSSSLRMTAFAAGSAAFGALLVAGPSVVILLGVGLHLVALGAGLAFGPHPMRLRAPRLTT